MKLFAYNTLTSSQSESREFLERSFLPLYPSAASRIYYTQGSFGTATRIRYSQASDLDIVSSPSFPKKPPYVSIIRALIEEDKLTAARTLLATAMSEGQSEPEIQALQTVLALPKVRPSNKRDAKRDDEYHWLEQHSAEHRGKWVAVSGSDLVAEGNTLKELRTKLASLTQAKTSLVHYIP